MRINTFDDYQEAAQKTAIYPAEAKIVYAALGLAGEAGEVAGKVSKVLRDDRRELTPDRREQIKKEIGDVMWFVAALCTDLHLNLGDVCRSNITKLLDRQERGTLKGDGDER